MRLAGLDSSLAAAHDESESLQTALARAGHGEGAAAIASQLSASENNRRAMLTAAMNYPTIFKRRAGPAVTLIAVEWPDGRTFSGTGFGVDAAGLIVTNRHLVADSVGRSPQAHRRDLQRHQALAARARGAREPMTATSRSCRSRGAGASRWSPASRAPPRARPSARRWRSSAIPWAPRRRWRGAARRSPRARRSRSARWRSTSTTCIQMDASAWEGSSGSPVFATDGNVIGIVYGGAREAAGRIVYAVPAEKLAALLAQP